MNKMIFSMLLAFGSITSFAKDGFYMGASVGFGRARQNLEEPQSVIITRTDYTYEPTQAFQAAVDVGYRWHNWRFAVGVQSLIDGYELAIHTIGDPTAYVQYRFPHLNIPLRAGYNINIGKKLSLVPWLGASAGYNFNPIYFSKVSGRLQGDRIPNNAFGSGGYRRVSVMALVQVDVRYQESKAMAITLGPRYNYQVGSLQRFDLDKGHIEPVKLNSLIINLGIELSAPCLRSSASKHDEKAGNAQ